MQKEKSPRREVARKSSKRGKPGPKPSITLAVVKRVSERFGKGVPLKYALAAEQNPKINEENWKSALQAHPEFTPHLDAAKGKFLEASVAKLADSENLKYLCFLLERRFASDFAQPSTIEVNVENKLTVAGLPDDILERARVIARAEAKLISNG